MMMWRFHYFSYHEGANFNLKLQFVYLRTHINCELMERYECSCLSCTAQHNI